VQGSGAAVGCGGRVQPDRHVGTTISGPAERDFLDGSLVQIGGRAGGASSPAHTRSTPTFGSSTSAGPRDAAPASCQARPSAIQPRRQVGPKCCFFITPPTHTRLDPLLFALRCYPIGFLGYLMRIVAWLLSAVVAIVLLGSRSAAIVWDSGETCDTFASGSALLCYNACAQGCASTAVDTNSGNQGFICRRDTIGPPAVCRRMAWVAGPPQAQELVGRCSSGGCNSGSCRAIAVVVEGQIVGWLGRRVSGCARHSAAGRG